MSEIFFISDHHFGHKNVINFTSDDGSLVRPGYPNIDSMNEFLIDIHNAVVKPEDTVHFLGDVGWRFDKKLDKILRSLNGKKHLCVGNHDNIKWLAPYFEDAHMWVRFKDHGFMASHVPMNMSDLARGGYNVHGHTHEKVMYKDGTYGSPKNKFAVSTKHICVCVEQLDGIPVHIDDLAII